MAQYLDKDGLIYLWSKLKTQITNLNTGLASKANLNEGIFYVEGNSTTTGAWLGTNNRITEYYDGLTILYKINKAGASTTTLNINGLGAKTIYRGGTSKITTHYAVNNIIILAYMADLNSGCWMVLGDYDSNTYPSAYCSTSASTATKTATCTSYALLANSYIQVIMTYANTKAAALTLNINSKGAKAIYINGVISSATNYTLPAGSYFVYYDGTNYYFRTDGKITGNITGNSETATKDASGNVITSTYATKSELTTGLNGKANTSHTHAEYATTAALTTGLNGKANTSHTHSEYITEDILTDALAGKSDTSHTHAAPTLSSLGLTATATELNYVDGVTSNIQTQLNNKANTSHTHSGYASATDVTNLSTTVSNLGEALDNKANSSHTHSEYATKSELTTGLNGKANTSHTHSGYASATDVTNLSNTVSIISEDVGALGNTVQDISENIPIVNNGTITIKQGGTQKGSFTVNQSGSTTINLDATPTLSSLGLTATATELNYVDGVTSNIQTQLTGKASVSHTHSTYATTTALNNLTNIVQDISENMPISITINSVADLTSAATANQLSLLVSDTSRGGVIKIPQELDEYDGVFLWGDFIFSGYDHEEGFIGFTKIDNASNLRVTHIDFLVNNGVISSIYCYEESSASEETVGSLNDLNTTNKSSIVAAINEVKSMADSSEVGSSEWTYLTHCAFSSTNSAFNLTSYLNSYKELLILVCSVQADGIYHIGLSSSSTSTSLTDKVEHSDNDFYARFTIRKIKTSSTSYNNFYEMIANDSSHSLPQIHLSNMYTSTGNTYLRTVNVDSSSVSGWAKVWGR